MIKIMQENKGKEGKGKTGKGKEANIRSKVRKKLREKRRGKKSIKETEDKERTEIGRRDRQGEKQKKASGKQRKK